jgi:hypothetical protein
MIVAVLDLCTMEEREKVANLLHLPRNGIN